MACGRWLDLSGGASTVSAIALKFGADKKGKVHPFLFYIFNLDVISLGVIKLALMVLLANLYVKFSPHWIWAVRCEIQCIWGVYSRLNVL